MSQTLHTVTPSLAAELRGQKNGHATVEAVPRHSWVPIDLVALGNTPVEPPSVGGIVYRGGRHIFSGEPEALKSWLALVLCAEQIRAGSPVLYIDFEMGPRDTLARLRSLQLAVSDIAAHFVYLNPNEAIGDALGDIDALLDQRRPVAVVLDAMQGALALHALDENKASDVEKFYRTVVDPLRAYGAAIITLDHLTKATEGRGKWAIGSQRKLGAADVHIGLDVIQPFGRGKTGKAKLITHKDRHGYLPRPHAGELELTSDPDTELITWQIKLADPEQNTESFRPTFLMQRVSEYLDTQPEPVSRNAVERNVNGKAAALRTALDVLTAEGYIAEEPGKSGARLVHAIKPYRESSFLRPDLVPTSSGTNPNQSSSLRPSPYKGDEDEDEDEDEQEFPF